MPQLGEITTCRAGERFGRLTVLGEMMHHEFPGGAKVRRVKVRCDCGKEYTCLANNLRNATSCGCGKRAILIGSKFGRLTVLNDEPDRNGHRYVRTRCDCGADRVVCLTNLTSGLTNSCGCLRNERVVSALLKHGDAPAKGATVEYRCWTNMIGRCENPNNTAYERYGGRGIAVCQRWRGSFDDFLADMGRKPSPAHSIDRMNNDGNYEPSNCRWATSSEQRRNQRKDLKRRRRAKT